MIAIASMSVMMSFSSFAADANAITAAIDAAEEQGISATAIANMIKDAGGVTDGNAIDNNAGTVESFMYNGLQYWIYNNADSDNLVNDLKRDAGDAQAAAEASKNNVADVKKSYHDGIGGLFKPANLNGAAAAMSGVSPVVNLLSGLLATCSILGMTLFTACDVLYMTVPMMQKKMNNTAASGGALSRGSGAVSTGGGDTGGQKFAFVTDDAIRAYDKSQSGEGNMWTIYLKSRSIAFICSALVIYILLTGQMGLIIDFVLELVSGLIGVFEELASGISNAAP